MIGRRKLAAYFTAVTTSAGLWPFCHAFDTKGPASAATSDPGNIQLCPSATKSVVYPINITEVFSKSELSALRSTFNEPNGPSGTMIYGRHGHTRYQLDFPPSSVKTKGLVVICHGVLVSSMNYDLAANALAKNGYTVLRYDYFGHGYSKWDGADEFVEYNPDVFVDQLEDVLDAAAAATELNMEQALPDLVGFIGHSTGGLVGIYAEKRWREYVGSGSRRHIPKLILASPAIWAHKPPLAVLADKVPGLMTFVMKKIPALQPLAHNAVFDVINESFAFDKQTGKHYYLEEKLRMDGVYNRLFGRVENVPAHPFLTGAFIGINQHILRSDLLPGHVKTLKGLLGESKETKVQFLWGQGDVTVPYKENIRVAKQWEEIYGDSLQIATLDREFGHDLFLAGDDGTRVCMENILPFLDDR